jgi:chromosome segregation ATPase
MVTGRRAFPGDTAEAIAESMGNTTPLPISHPELDRLVGTCLSKDRAGRCQSMQHVVMKLKLLAGLERRSEPGVVLRHNRIEAKLRAEIQQLESRWTSTLERQQRVATEEHSILQQVSEVLLALREQISEIDGRLGDVQGRVTRAEQATEETRSEIAEQGTMLLDEFRELEQTVNTQAVAIERTRNRLVQTDDLVERVVEALESLQSLVLEQSEERIAVGG